MIVKLCNAKELPVPGTLKAFRRGALEICLARCDEHIYAFENKCPHQNAPLSAGTLEGCKVVCPYHAWRFNVATGEPDIAGDPPLLRYEVRQYLHEVFVQLPGSRDPAEALPPERY